MDTFACPEEQEMPPSRNLPAMIAALALPALFLVVGLALLLIAAGLMFRLEWVEAALNGIGGRRSLRYAVYAMTGLYGLWLAGGVLLMAWEARRKTDI